MPSNAVNSSDVLLETAIQRVREGEVRAYEKVVRGLERPLRAWLATHAPPGLDVDELAQRTFIIAYQQLNRYQPGTHFKGWFFSIARAQLRGEITRLRRIADYHSRLAPDILQKELDRLTEQDQEGRQEKRLDHLKECLESLGDTARNYITWRYDHELPLDAISKKTGRSIGAIKKQLWNIRRHLQACMEGKMRTEHPEPGH